MGDPVGDHDVAGLPEHADRRRDAGAAPERGLQLPGGVPQQAHPADPPQDGHVRRRELPRDALV